MEGGQEGNEKKRKVGKRERERRQEGRRHTNNTLTMNGEGDVVLECGLRQVGAMG